MRRLMMQRQQAMGKDAPAPPPHTTYAYGPDKEQDLDLFMPAHRQGPVPLVLFVHGGAWSKGSKETATGRWKAGHYTGLGYAFATINYRLVPRVGVQQQAEDVALALRQMIRDAATLGIDPHRIVLMGHSAGAQLVALVGTDESYLASAGLSFADLAGVIPIDGAAYDVPEQMKASGAYMGMRYDAAFSKDPDRQKALSAKLHAAAPNAPRFLLLHVQRPDGIAQAQELARALRAAGTSVEVRSFAGNGLIGHITINQRLGDPDYPATGVVDGWLKQVFGA
ncbi:MAG: alpha/beta hydrolase [Sphingomonadales bacterium]|nr:alpha/beta hydrolase [Sphingomonadales bacterium]MDE2169685.1 alpha/beta hydrolase [Sphingomonadales bacterium]